MTTPGQDNESDAMLGKDGSSTAQPFGLCIPSCDPKDSKCPQGTQCTEMFDTRTRQSLQTWGCTKIVERNQPCLNNTSCKKGDLCARHGFKRPHWFCLQDCTNDPSVCASGEECVELEDNPKQKVCKTLRKVGEICTPAQTCGKDAACIQAGLDNFPARCHKRCEQNAQACDKDKEVCRTGTTTARKGVKVCFQKAAYRQSCRRGAACGTLDDLCVGLNKEFAACFKACKDDKDCDKDERCDTISTSSDITACRLQVPAGDYSVNLAQCARGGHTVRFADNQPPICLADCTIDNNPAPEFCGSVSPYPLTAVAASDGDERFAVGSGLVAYSTDQGQSWKRLPVLDNYDNLAVLASPKGDTLWVAGVKGRLFLYKREATDWKVTQVALSTKTDLHSLSLDHSGQIILLAGDNGTLLRSENAGQDWKSITVTQDKTVHFKAVRFLPSSVEQGKVALLSDSLGNLYRSEDSGQTWTIVHKGKKGLLGLAVRKSRDSSFDAIAVGEDGVLLTSNTAGKQWKEVTTSIKTRLRTAVQLEKEVLVAGDNGSMLRFDGTDWKKQDFPTPQQLRTIYDFVLPTKGSLLMVGSLGSVFLSDDNGKKWSQTSSRLLGCLKITIPSAADAGVCVFRCDPANKGSDCPARLSACKKLTVAGQDTYICQHPGKRVGSAELGSRCNPYDGAVASERCNTGLECVTIVGQHRCIRPCSQDRDCQKGSCQFHRLLRRKTCQTTDASEGQECSPLTSSGCAKGLRCSFNEYLQKGRCVSLSPRKAGEFCLREDTGQWSCEGDLVCAGSSATPYRLFCSQRCTPGKGGCSSGQTCIPDTVLGGVCVQECSKSNTTCSIKTLQCRAPFESTAKQYCL